MKKLTILGLALALTAPAAFAAHSDTLLLKGKVNQVLSILVTPETLAANLPLDVSQSASKVGTVNEKSNSATGYKVTINSANGGKLVNTVVTSETFNYALKYDGNAINLVTGQTFTFSTPGAYDVNKDVNITYTGIPETNMVAGTYKDTVTFTIAVN